jgi:FkbM family methyltransferase
MTQTSTQPLFGMRAALAGLRDRGYQPEVVYDIGAADGGWTREALQIWPLAKFVCFEPLAERRAALDTLVAERRGQVSLQPVGVGDADTELSLGITDFLWDSSFAYSGKSARKVAVRRLDSLLDEGAIPRPSFVKIDVQGFEMRVIAGGADTFSGADFVLMECNFIAFCDDMRTLDESIRYMSERGFVPYEFVDFLRRPLDNAMGQCDILFARRGHALVSDRRWAA